MKGEIEQRGDGVWRVRVFAGREAGRRRYVSRTVHGGKRAAHLAAKTGQWPDRAILEQLLDFLVFEGAAARMFG